MFGETLSDHGISCFCSAPHIPRSTMVEDREITGLSVVLSAVFECDRSAGAENTSIILASVQSAVQNASAVSTTVTVRPFHPVRLSRSVHYN